MTEVFSATADTEDQWRRVSFTLLVFMISIRDLQRSFRRFSLSPAPAVPVLIRVCCSLHLKTTWTSDDWNASERQKIQYGYTSFVSSIWWAWDLMYLLFRIIRCFTWDTNWDSCKCCVLWNIWLWAWSEQSFPRKSLKDLKGQVTFMKKNRKLISTGRWFLSPPQPLEGNDTAWMVVSQDKQAVAAFYQRLNKINASWLRFTLVWMSTVIWGKWGRTDLSGIWWWTDVCRNCYRQRVSE